MRFVLRLSNPFKWSWLKLQANVEEFHLASTKIQRCLGLSASERRAFETKLLIQYYHLGNADTLQNGIKA